MAKHCKECGKSFEPRQWDSEFCCTGCRRNFNNRRAVRGAMLYDVVMLQAFDPDLAERMGLTGSVQDLAYKFREEDLADGRPRSWKRAGAVVNSVERLIKGSS